MSSGFSANLGLLNNILLNTKVSKNGDLINGQLGIGVLTQSANLCVSGSSHFNGSVTVSKNPNAGILVDTAEPEYPWRDILGQIVITSTGPTKPVFNTFLSQVGAYSFASGDDCNISFHLPHDYAAGTDIFLHFHWSHNGTAITGSSVFNCYQTYAKGHNQANFSVEKLVTLTVPTPNISTVPQYRHRIDEIQISSNGGSATLLDSSLFEPDGIIMHHLDWATIPTITGGTPNEPFLFYIDVHYQSTNIGTKQKTPNFYV